MVGSSGRRSLEDTPTWVIAAVCSVLVLVSLSIEHSIHLLGKWLAKNHMPDLYETLEKIKSELMLMGFISLLLTVLQGPISQICVSERIVQTMFPCPRKVDQHTNGIKGGSEGQSFGDSVSVMM